MYPAGPAQYFKWPQHKDTCWVSFCSIRLPISTPHTINKKINAIKKEDILATKMKFYHKNIFQKNSIVFILLNRKHFFAS